MKQSTFIVLRALLAEFYPDVDSIRRVLHDAGIDAARINLNAVPLDSWHAVLIEAEKCDQLAALLAIVKEEYGNNPKFQHLYRSTLGKRIITWLRKHPAVWLGSLVLVLLLSIVFWWNLDKFHPTPAPLLCPAERRCLLVADFAPATEPLAAELSRKSKIKLDSQLSPAIFAVRQTDAVVDAATAQQLGRREGAFVVMWGEIFTQSKELQIFFALTDQLGVSESHQVRPYRAEFFETISQQLDCQQRCFEDVKMRSAAVDQISTVIAYTAAGLLHYANDQPEAADRDFTAALLCSGQPVDLPVTDPAVTSLTPVTVTSTLSTTAVVPACATAQALAGFNPAAIYYYAGKAKILVGDYVTAIAYLQRAATVNPQDPAAPLAIATVYQSWLNQDDAPQAQAVLTQARQRATALRAELLPQGVSQQIAAVDYELGLIAELAGDRPTAQAKYAAAANGFGRSNFCGLCRPDGLGACTTSGWPS